MKMRVQATRFGYYSTYIAKTGLLTFSLRMMVLKKNGEECNKPHLTFNLGGSDSGCGDHNTEAPMAVYLHVPSHTTATAAADSAEPAGEESYMVMNSARTVLSSIKNVGSTPQNDA